MSKSESTNQLATDKDIKILMKHNALIKAKYSLTLVQNRVFEFLLYNFQKEKDGVLSCKIHRDDFKKLIGKEKDKTIKGISDLLESLRVKEILIAEKIKEKQKYKWHRFGLINGSIYDEDADIFTVKATEEIYTLIQEYYDKKGGYTPVNLIVKLSMNNYYAQRLYDLLRIWSGTKKVITYDVAELKELLQIEEKYNLYADFKRRVILPAIKELNSTGYFEIEIKENKTGRKVDSIDFIVKDLDKRKYFTKDDTKKEIENSVVHEIAISVDEEDDDMFNEKESLFKPNYSIQKESNSGNDIYVPDKSVFTAGTLRSFKIDFGYVDFNNEYMKKAFDDAVMITLDRDDVEKIKAASYKFFKSTLKNKIEEYEKEEIEDIEHKRNIEMFW